VSREWFWLVLLGGRERVGEIMDDLGELRVRGNGSFVCHLIHQTPPSSWIKLLVCRDFRRMALRADADHQLASRPGRQLSHARRLVGKDSAPLPSNRTSAQVRQQMKKHA
jgi:hypothetical protein